MKENQKVIVIGLDGATWNLIKPWADEGELPTFKKLMNEGIWGELESTMPPVTFPAWKCFSTGKNPGKLGVYGHVQFEDGKLIFCNATTVKDNKEIWDYLSDHEKVAVVGVPITYPPKAVNGIMVSGPFSVGHKYTFPPDLQSKLEAKYNYKPYPEEFLLKDSMEEHVDMLVTTVDAKFNFLDDIIADYNFICFVIFETDTAQHFLWGNKALKHLWKRIDERLKKIVRFIEANNNATLILCSDHGFSESQGAFYVNEWLRQEGYLKLKDRVRIFQLLARFGFNVENIYGFIERTKLLNLIRKILPPEYQMKIGKSIPRKTGLLNQECIYMVNLKKSKALFQNGLYVLNSDPETIEEIYNKLMNLKDKAGNQFLDVKKTAEVYFGMYVKNAPEILIWSDKYSVNGHIWLKGSSSAPFLPSRRWNGIHHRKGIFLAYGPGIKKGKINNAKIYDLAPTILHMFRLPIPDDMDGRALIEIFSADSELANRKVEYERELRKRTEEVIRRLKTNEGSGEV